MKPKNLLSLLAAIGVVSCFITPATAADNAVKPAALNTTAPTTLEPGRFCSITSVGSILVEIDGAGEVESYLWREGKRHCDWSTRGTWKPGYMSAKIIDGAADGGNIEHIVVQNVRVDPDGRGFDVEYKGVDGDYTFRKIGHLKDGKT